MLAIFTNLVDSSGLILTNYHVVSGADVVQIQFASQKKGGSSEDLVEGKIVGSDPELDIALIKVKTNRKLVPLKLGNSNTL